MAGRGTRLRPHTLTVPKPLLRFAGKAMVEHIIDEIVLSLGDNNSDNNGSNSERSARIDEIGFVCGHFGEDVEKKLIECAAAKGARGHIFYQDEPLGTGHAVLCAEPLLKNEVVVAFADTLFIGGENILSRAQRIQTATTVATASADRQTANIETTVDRNRSCSASDAVSDAVAKNQPDAIIFTGKVENPQAFGVVVTDEVGRISGFVEKPQVFISDEAIIGIYYFRDGEILRRELQNLIDTDFKRGKEYQLTDALENMLGRKNINFIKANVKEWLDCGNKNATENTHSRLLEQKPNLHYISPNITVNNSEIIPPCYIADGVTLEDAVIGPCVSLEKKSIIKKSSLKHSIVGQETIIENSTLTKSMIGSRAVIRNHNGEVSISDYSEIL
jgi:glucose-1-phosphate thymidylyltransferase